MLERIIDFLRSKPGYRNEGGYRLSNILKKQGWDVDEQICRKALYRFSKENEMGVSEDDLDQVNQIKKQHQRISDVNRIERKLWRNRVRFENALTDLNSELINALDKEKIILDDVSSDVRYTKNKMIVQLTDTHFNELVNLKGNKYDFYVASKRLQKYANEIKIMVRARDISDVVLALTGDLLNSDRRIDELLNTATNRAHASILGAKLIANFIADIHTVANVTVLSVSGNESRMKDEFSFDDFLLSDNYDFLIYNMLKMLLEDNDGIQFLDTDPFEAILSINGTKILVTHGTNVKKDTQQSIQQIVGKHAIKGDIIDYIIFGHIHFANITDLYSRSGSLVGGNTYSERELNLATIASQVIHFVDDNGDIHNYRVNLQNTDGYDGYSISNDYDAYNPQLSNYKKRSKVINL